MLATKSRYLVMIITKPHPRCQDAQVVKKNLATIMQFWLGYNVFILILTGVLLCLPSENPENIYNQKIKSN